MKYREIKVLSGDVVRKIAAGEVVERPASIVRELMDNAVDSGADKISVEITGGGIKSVKVADNGCGMSGRDLEIAATSHATSKISSEKDLLALETLGFRGEALYSLAAVSELVITSRGKRLQVMQNGKRNISSYAETEGTIVECRELFSSFPARRVFLKREQSEGAACKATFAEKALPVSKCAFSFVQDGSLRLAVPQGIPLAERFTKLMGISESANLFYEIKGEAGKDFSFTLLVGDPGVYRRNRRDIYTYVNGRRISEFALSHAIEYGVQGFFPNGTLPVACLFVKANPALVDFNIHPAKKEARFSDTSALHRAIVLSLKDFFRDYTARTFHSAQYEASEEVPSYLPLEKDEEENNSFITAIKSMKNAKLPRTFTYESAKKTPFIHSSFSSYSPYKRAKERAYDEKKERDETGEIKFLSSVFDTFLLAEKGETLYIIDQHAANERLLFDKLMKQKQNPKPLLLPYVIKVKDDAEDSYLASIQEELLECGFKMQKVSEDEWHVLSTAELWNGDEKEFTDFVVEQRRLSSGILYNLCASIACRASVKAGDTLERESAAALAAAALELSDPHCPHGRPVYFTLTREELFRRVRRTE